MPYASTLTTEGREGEGYWRGTLQNCLKQKSISKCQLFVPRFSKYLRSLYTGLFTLNCFGIVTWWIQMLHEIKSKSFINPFCDLTNPDLYLIFVDPVMKVYTTVITNLTFLSEKMCMKHKFHSWKLATFVVDYTNRATHQVEPCVFIFFGKILQFLLDLDSRFVQQFLVFTIHITADFTGVNSRHFPVDF